MMRGLDRTKPLTTGLLLMVLLAACGGDQVAESTDDRAATEEGTVAGTDPSEEASEEGSEATEGTLEESSEEVAATGECPSLPEGVLLEQGTVTMAVNATIPPVQFVEDGELRGMRIELGEQIAERLCLELEWVNIQFDAMIPGLGQRWDAINTGLFYTEERAEQMELVPYELQAISISVPQGTEGVESTEDLAGMAVAVEVGGYEETQIRDINDEQVAADLEPMDIRTFNTFADAYQALQARQVQAVVSVDATATFYQEQGNFDRAVSGIAGSPASLAFADTELAQAVADVLAQMQADGTYDEIFDAYGVAKIMEWEEWEGDFQVY